MLLPKPNILFGMVSLAISSESSTEPKPVERLDRYTRVIKEKRNKHCPNFLLAVAKATVAMRLARLYKQMECAGKVERLTHMAWQGSARMFKGAKVIRDITCATSICPSDTLV